ncbi:MULTISPECIES: hypothetical protein [Microbacterium]|uniref:hypothetical protein n=1 Tax=Microbacterium TaxID=33882 RepID=UPI0028A293DC|nr:hypothetical protein [Microbacterium sp.]
MTESLGDSPDEPAVAERKLRRRGWLIALLAVGWLGMTVGGAFLFAGLTGRWIPTVFLGLTIGLGMFIQLIRDQKRCRRELINAGSVQGKEAAHGPDADTQSSHDTADPQG